MCARSSLAAWFLLVIAAAAHAEDRVRVYAAASLSERLPVVARAYEARSRDAVSCNFAASGVLARQIAAGARADVYISADPKWMDRLAQRGRIGAGSRTPLLRNRLALVTPAGVERAVRLDGASSLPGFLETGRLAIGDPAAVPAGRYAKQALTHLGWWDRLRGRLVTASDVRAALRFVATGRVRAGIVYRSDARASDRVRALALLPAGSHAPIVYPAAICRPVTDRAERFLRFLRGPRAAAILEAGGFETAGTRPGAATRPIPGKADAGGPAWRPGPAEWRALLLSVRVAAVAVAIGAVPAVLVAWVLARWAFRGKMILEALLHLPLVLPPVVVGWGLLLLFQRGSPLAVALGELGIEIAFTWKAAALAAAIVGFPLMVRSVRLGLELVDRGLEDAARSLGARPLDRWLTVTLPLAAPGIVTGAILAFARALGEFGATITFAGNVAGETRTLPLAIYRHTQVPGEALPAMRLAGLSVLLSLAALMVSEWLARRLRRRLEAE